LEVRIVKDKVEISDFARKTDVLVDGEIVEVDRVGVFFLIEIFLSWEYCEALFIRKLAAGFFFGFPEEKRNPTSSSSGSSSDKRGACRSTILHAASIKST